MPAYYRRTCKEANDDMAWFTPEDQVLIGFLKEIAEQGFPDTNRYLREHVNALLRAKKGDPTFSVVSIGLITGWSATMTSSGNTGLLPLIMSMQRPSTLLLFQITSQRSTRSSQSTRLTPIAYGQWMKQASSSIILPRRG